LVKHVIFILVFVFSLQVSSEDKTCPDDSCMDELSLFLAGERFEQAKRGETVARFSTLNDSAYGVYQLATGDKLGDDFGETHGVILEIAHTDRVGVNYKLVYFTNLYSEQISDEYRTDENGSTFDQYFTEESVLKFIINNRSQNQSEYFEYGVGIMELNRDKVGSWLSSSKQQVVFHDLIGSFHPNNIPSAKGNQRGIFVEAEAGKDIVLYKNESQTIRVVGNIAIRSVVNTIKDASSVSLVNGINFYSQKGKNTFAYKAGAKFVSTAHQTSSNPSNSLVFSVGIAKGDYSFELLLHKTISGDRQNYQNYNLDDDPVLTLQFTGKIKPN
jgi:hypothetical protein